MNFESRNLTKSRRNNDTLSSVYLRLLSKKVTKLLEMLSVTF